MTKRTCSVEGCDRPHRAHGLCSTHYAASPERRAQVSAAVARYRVTSKGKAANYRSVAKYQAAHKDRIAAQRATPEGKAYYAAYHAARRATPEGKAERIADEQLRRARKRGVEAYRVVRADLVERDAGVCRLCGLAVPAEAVWPNPLSASMDHILPLSLGGPHTAENLQLAHLACNVRKGNRAVA